MIQLTGAAKRFGPKTLFENLDWLVTPNERAGIVGANGTGKSTLLKILAGMDSLDAGSITVMKGASVGYLPQEGLSLSGRTVFAECMTVFADLLALEQDAPLPNEWGELRLIGRWGRGIRRRLPGILPTLVNLCCLKASLEGVNLGQNRTTKREGGNAAESETLSASGSRRPPAAGRGNAAPVQEEEAAGDLPL